MCVSEIDTQISRLVYFGIVKGLIQEVDRTYVTNRILALLKRFEFGIDENPNPIKYPNEALSELCDYAVKSGIIEPDIGARDLFDTEIMNCMVPRPSEVVTQFYEEFLISPRHATDFYYALSQNSNYIRMDRIVKDLMWHTETPYGSLIITVNLSKPEKDPKAIAAAKNLPQSGYPKCALCPENEGFQGGAEQAPRASHRIIPLNLSQENWFLQYSPYVYYPEHCIVISEHHEPMQVNRRSMARLLDFIEQFPHYFVGSNADLPIVGGSILSHDHFQGGNFEFPMAKAELRESLVFSGFEDVEAGVLSWPMSVIRLTSHNRARLLDLAEKILTAWREYSDPEVEILAYSKDSPHNTITPICRRRGDKYQIDLVLRNNRTSKEHPLGIFHPHEEYHHIKKENIGLIEVMGLAILPPRLVEEMRLMREALLNPLDIDLLEVSGMEKHVSWYADLKHQKLNIEQKETQMFKEKTEGIDVNVNANDRMESMIKDSIGTIFGRILENAGVYKDTAVGQAAFRKFCQTVT